MTRFTFRTFGLYKYNMKKYETLPRQTLVDILCDVCGASCKTQINDFEYATLSASWGYCSRKDGESYSATLCENCFDNVAAHIATMTAAQKPK